jgi:hypothetical protein
MCNLSDTEVRAKKNAVGLGWVGVVLRSILLGAFMLFAFDGE